MSDPIADLLTRMRNALQAGHTTVDVPASNLKQEICRVLKEQGFVKDGEKTVEQYLEGNSVTEFVRFSI